MGISLLRVPKMDFTSEEPSESGVTDAAAMD